MRKLFAALLASVALGLAGGAIADDKLTSIEDRFLSGLAALFYNVEAVEGDDHQVRFDKGKVLEVIGRIDTMIDDQMNEILHHPKVQELEATWRGLADLVEHTNFRANIAIDILDVAKDRGASLIVVGSRGRGGFKGMLLGSTSQKVLQHAEAPVMIVRA